MSALPSKRERMITMKKLLKGTLILGILALIAYKIYEHLNKEDRFEEEDTFEEEPEEKTLAKKLHAAAKKIAD